MLTYVLSADGSPLMPTYNIKKVRRMLKDGRAVITGHKPEFMIQLTYVLPEQGAPHTQETEFCEDTGDHHIGVSVKSAKHEYFHGQFDLLTDEKQRHDDCRTYRRTRRNHKRYRKPRFDNRRRKAGWFAPSVENKAQRHADIFAMFAKVLPVKSATLETARFDTQLLEAQQTGSKLPQGKDYQHGPRFKLINLREAVFTRDGYRCQICGKSVSDGAILRVHHALYWKGDHTDRLSGLITVCDKCHTPKNHQKDGRLWGVTPEVKSMAGAAFMNAIRWHIAEIFRSGFPDVEIHTTNGAATKASRRMQRMAKTHANDAYCMGEFRPRHKAKEMHYKKHRRNNRVLSKFYDAKYIDTRTGKKASGKELGSNRTNRSVPRDNPNNLRKYHGKKVSKGSVRTRKQHYRYQSGDTVLVNGRKEVISGIQNCGTVVKLRQMRPDGGIATVSVKKTRLWHSVGSWEIVVR